MGTTSSTPARSRTPEQEDINFLGERMPFGDQELLHVYRTYRKFIDSTTTTTTTTTTKSIAPEDVSDKSDHELTSSSSSSFILKIGTSTVTPTRNVDINNNNTNNSNNDIIRLDRQRRLIFMEEKLLPTGFGNRWYEVAFRPTYGSSFSSTNAFHDPNDHNDNDDRNKLEAFFNGLSNCSRRGNDKALRVLFDCCQGMITDGRGGGDPSSTPVGGQPSPPPPPTMTDFAYGSNPSPFTSHQSLSSSSDQKIIDPMELVNIAYRVGLAAKFLSKPPTTTTTTTDECKDDDEQENTENGTNLPPDQPTTTTVGSEEDQYVSVLVDRETEAGLKAMASSLIEYCNRRKQRIYHVVQPETTHVNWEEVKEWADHSMPMLGAALATFTHQLFFPNIPPPPTRTSFDFPTFGDFTSTLISNPSSSLLFNLACMSPSLGGEYYRLYTSASDGLSFNRLQNALLGYGGPTLILIQSGASIFGAFTASAWKESKDFYGNHDCFLYQLLPRIGVYHPSGKASNFMYCNSFARSRGYDKQSHGIGFGGTTDQPRLFLAESFDNCRAAAQDLTFEGGRLLDHNGTTFEIDNLEVWGVGGTQVVEEALGARRLQRDIKDAAIQKARKVDKAQFLDDFRSGVIDSKAFQHRQQIQGREGCDVGEDDLKR